MEINKALKFAAVAHKGQERKNSMLPYIIHPVAVMNIIKHYNPDAKVSTLVAALLHDVVEDTVHTIHEIREMFGDTVAYLVDGMTKVEYAEDLRSTKNHKRAIDNSKHCDVIQYIKLADMLQNLEDIHLFNKKYGIMFLREKLMFLEYSSQNVQNTELAKALKNKITEGLTIFHTEKTDDAN